MHRRREVHRPLHQPGEALRILALLAAVLALGIARAAECPPEAQLIHLLTSQGELYRYHPLKGSLDRVGKLECSQRAEPFSMTLSRDGTAWIVLDDGTLYTADARTAAQCKPTAFKRGQDNFTTFGMGFMLDSDGQERLYVSASAPLGGVGYRLGLLNHQRLTLKAVGVYEGLKARAELTGTGDGRLFGAFEGAPYVVAELDPETARVISKVPQPAISYPPQFSHFAFAFWGGEFWIFVGPYGGHTDVFRYSPEKHTTEKVVRFSQEFIGAGVSTCAPTRLPSEKVTLPAPTADRSGALPGETAAAPPSPAGVPPSGSTGDANGALAANSLASEQGATLAPAPPKALPAPTIRPPPVLDFGELTAGSPAACQPLDLSASADLVGHALAVSGADLAGCKSALYLQAGTTRRPLPADSGPLQSPALSVCLAVPACAADASPPGAALTLTPAGHPAAAATVPLRWTVRGRSWLDCHAWWLAPACGLPVFGFFLLGFLRPHRFPADAVVQTAGSPEGLRRASPIRLRDCPGAGPGFYRSARLGLHPDGSLNGRLRGAALVLRATRRGILLDPRAALEIQRRQRWEAAGADPVTPAAGEVFRAGDLHVRFDGI